MVEGETFRMKFRMSRMTMWGFSIVSGRRIRARAMPESAEMALLHDRLGIGCRNCQAHRVLAQVAP